MVGAKKAPFRISTLIFLRDEKERFLMLLRNRSPNQGRWSPIGGKLEMGFGESPFECARRETMEEVGVQLSDEDLHLFAYVSEKNFEGEKHWLMFLFHCRKRLTELPPPIDEGSFGFFSREEINDLPIPDTDDRLVWSLFDQFHEGFAGVRADCSNPKSMNAILETRVSELVRPFLPRPS
ncbi:MAG: NUDIX domain-containing protein [Verrucomicrobiota bacterium]